MKNLEPNDRMFLSFTVFPDSYLRDEKYEPAITLTNQKWRNRFMLSVDGINTGILLMIWRIILLAFSKKARQENDVRITEVTGFYCGQIDENLHVLAESPDSMIVRRWLKIHSAIGSVNWNYLTTKIQIESESDEGKKWHELSQKGLPLRILISFDQRGKRVQVESISTLSKIPLRLTQTLTVFLQEKYSGLLVADTTQFNAIWAKDAGIQVSNGVADPMMILELKQ